MNGIAGLQHIGLPVRSVENTRAFYEGLGFKTLYSMEDAGKRVAFLGLNGLVIEIYEAEGSLSGDSTWDHLAIDVSDIEDVWRSIVIEEGNTSVEGEIRFLPYWERGVRFFTIKGPDNEKIEFCQKL